MPFIVTTKRPDALDAMHGRLGIATEDSLRRISRVAVATLEEARDAVKHVLYGPESISESGGTVGPLPDGTLIEIEAIGLRDLFARAVDLPGMFVRAIETTPDSGMVSVTWPARESVIIDAFNAREVSDAA